jgi:hypothetical protein
MVTSPRAASHVMRWPPRAAGVPGVAAETAHVDAVIKNVRAS